MFEKKQTKIAALTVGALGIALIGGGFAAAQTKQLKAPASASVVVSEDDAQASAQAQATATDPNVESSSYSVVIESYPVQESLAKRTTGSRRGKDP